MDNRYKFTQKLYSGNGTGYGIGNRLGQFELDGNIWSYELWVCKEHESLENEYEFYGADTSSYKLFDIVTEFRIAVAHL